MHQPHEFHRALAPEVQDRRRPFRQTPCRFPPGDTFSVIKKVNRDDEALLTFSPPDLAPTLRRFVVEREMGTAVALLRDVGGPRFRLSVFFLQGGRGRFYGVPDRLKTVGGIQVSTNGSHYYLSFPAKWLDYKPVTANPTMATMCDQACRRLLERRHAVSQVSELIKEYLTDRVDLPGHSHTGNNQQTHQH